MFLKTLVATQVENTVFEKYFNIENPVKWKRHPKEKGLLSFFTLINITAPKGTAVWFPEASLLYMLQSINSQALFIFRDNKIFFVLDVRLSARNERA
jgi:hypothetical protein